MRKLSHVSALVLAGGESRRMGRNKALIEFAGRTLVERVADIAAEIFAEVYLSGPPELDRFHRPRIEDSRPGAGPMSALLDGFRRIHSPWIFLLPCDSPLVPSDFLRGMAGLAEDCEVVVPRWHGYYEPLHALYSRRCIPCLEKLIHRGESKIINLYEAVRVREVEEERIRRWDPDGRAFLNINTPQDLARVELYFSSQSG